MTIPDLGQSVTVKHADDLGGGVCVQRDHFTLCLDARAAVLDEGEWKKLKDTGDALFAEARLWSVQQQGGAVTGPQLSVRVAAWIVQERIAAAAPAPEVAERLITAAGQAQVEAWLASGARELRDAATAIASLEALGDAGWAAENCLHGHDGNPRPGTGRKAS